MEASEKKLMEISQAVVNAKAALRKKHQSIVRLKSARTMTAANVQQAA